VFEFSFVVVVVVVVFFLVLSRVILYSSFVRSKIQKIKKSPGKNTHKKEEALKARQGRKKGVFTTTEKDGIIGRDLRRCDSVWASAFDLVTREAVVFRFVRAGDVADGRDTSSSWSSSSTSSSTALVFLSNLGDKRGRRRWNWTG